MSTSIPRVHWEIQKAELIFLRKTPNPQWLEEAMGTIPHPCYGICSTERHCSGGSKPSPLFPFIYGCCSRIIGLEEQYWEFIKMFYINGIFWPGDVGLPPTPPPLPGVVIEKRKRYTVEEVSKSESWVITTDKLNKKKQVSCREPDLKGKKKKTNSYYQTHCPPWSECLGTFSLPKCQL